MFGYIYKFTMIPTGKIYIGKRECPSFDEHYWGSGKLWKVDLEKYGKNSVLREVLDWAESRKELKEKEVHWISTFNSQNPSIGYNVHKGGSGGNMVGNTELWSEMHSGEKNGRYGKPVSQDTRDKIGIKNKDKTRSQEFKDNVSKKLKGRSKPEGFGEKVSARLKGVPKSDEHKAKIGNSLRGTSWGSHTEETKKKISKSLTGRPGLKGELNGMFNKKHTDEVKQKMSATLCDGRRKGANNSRAKSVVCIETGKIYGCIKDAEKDTGASHIGDVCRGVFEVSCKVKLHWRWAEEDED